MARARALTGLDLQASTAQIAREIVRERLADMYACARYIDKSKNIHELHDLRIATKRVRYTLEIFAPFLPAESSNFAEELATLQDELGELHDSEVMLALLRLPLQPDEAEVAIVQAMVPPVGTCKPLLSLELIASVTHPSDVPGTKECRGLAGFLRRQEERREQSYRAFRQHWERLEQEHFREKLVAL